nr:MAG TPA: hypothetical protein [Caudoviricetes sp.]
MTAGKRNGSTLRSTSNSMAFCTRFRSLTLQITCWKGRTSL